MKKILPYSEFEINPLLPSRVIVCSNQTGRRTWLKFYTQQWKSAINSFFFPLHRKRGHILFASSTFITLLRTDQEPNTFHTVTVWFECTISFGGSDHVNNKHCQVSPIFVTDPSITYVRQIIDKTSKMLSIHPNQKNFP